MSSKLDLYLQDLVYLIKEKYNDTLKSSLETLEECDKAFELGKQIAYHDVLDLINSQLMAFGEESEMIGKIVPEIGKKAQFSDA